MLKHFALNEQETNRVNNGIATWATEQTIREIYLKPFEMVVKDTSMPVATSPTTRARSPRRRSAPAAIMSSFNRIGAVWAGGSEALMTDVLRGEWGFEGFAISDFNLYPYMNPNQSISAGTDLTLTFQPSKSLADTDSAKARTDIREATHNILFTVTNSNAMNGIAPGATVDYTPPDLGLRPDRREHPARAARGRRVFMVTRRVRRHRKRRRSVVATETHDEHVSA